MSKKKTIGKDNKKFSLREFVWLGFNYTVGIGFIGVIGILGNGKAFGNNDNGIGLNTLWVLMIEGILAGTIAMAFAKMARMYNSSNNGGAYIFVRGTFGKFMGIFVAFMLYVGMPFMITNQVMTLIKGTFSPAFAKPIGDTNPFYIADWGPFTDLSLDLMGIAIYMGSAVVIFGGIKIYKKLAMTTTYVKWGAACFLILAAIIMGGASLAGAGPESGAIQAWGQASKLNGSNDLQHIITTFNTCFYFFAGFEIFSTAGHNVENPNRNIGLGITIIMIISTIFYILIMFLFFASLSPTHFTQNATMSAWFNWFGTDKNNHAVYWIYFIGPCIMIISSVALKINAAMQNSLYGGTALQPLCVEGYFPEKLGHLNKDGLPIRASTVNLVIVGFFIIIWLAVPDLIKGIQCTGHTPIPDVATSNPGKPWYYAGGYEDAFNVATLTEASAVVTIFVYILVLASTLATSGRNKLKLKLWETIGYTIALIFLAILFLTHYYTVFKSIAEGAKKDDAGELLGGLIEVVFIISAAVFATIWYHSYYKSVVGRRNDKDPKIQMKLDKEFEMIPVEFEEPNVNA